jgi:putative membrane protein
VQRFFYMNFMGNTESKPAKLSLTDWLALERTRLANERTFLAYFRTAFALLAGGLTIARLEVLQDIRGLGYAFIVIAPITLLIGTWRLYKVNKKIDRHYDGDARQ